jgi:hypothetical protein
MIHVVAWYYAENFLGLFKDYFSSEDRSTANLYGNDEPIALTLNFIFEASVR